MRILAVGHSLQAERQQRFYQYIESLGHEVKLLVPDWGTRVRGFLDKVRGFKPDWVYCQDEADGSVFQAIRAKREFGVRIALFQWENLPHMKRLPKRVLDEFDLLIAGCLGALRLLERMGIQGYPKPIPQVGIDTRVFAPQNTGVSSDFDTCTSAGFTVNKGVGLIEQVVRKLKFKHLWLGWRRRFDLMPYDGFPTYGHWPGKQPYEDLPKWYVKAKVHLLASRDTPQWSEQFAPHSNLETLACGLRVVTSDAGEIPNFLKGCPGAKIVPQGDLNELEQSIVESLKDPSPNEQGREFVIKHYSMEVVARELLEALGG